MTDISDASGGNPKPSGTFKYKRQLFLNIVALFYVGAGGYLLCLLESARHGAVPLAEVVIWALYAFVVLILFIGSVNRSDVLVDEQGISKRYLGFLPWGRMRWDRVRKIRVALLSNALTYSSRPGITRIIAVLPFIPGRFGLYRSGAVTLDDSVEHADELIKVMNHYIAQYNIEVVELAGPGGEKTVECL